MISTEAAYVVGWEGFFAVIEVERIESGLSIAVYWS